MWRIHLLGELDIRSESDSSICLPSRKSEALLALLARHPGKRIAREKLAALLWPESREFNARVSLRQTLKQLRQSLARPGEEVIVVTGNALAIEPSLVRVDVVSFEELSEMGSRAALEEAADLYRGEFLEEVADLTEPFAEWVAFERMQLREQMLALLEKLMPGDPNASQTERAIQKAVNLLASDPLDERVHRLLMQLYQEQGRRSDALKQYRSCSALIQRNLSAQCDPRTEALYRQILEGGRHVCAEVRPQTARIVPAALDAILSRPAVAVLPFANLNGDPSQAYFSDGVAEDITTMLAGWRRFPLIASSSSLTCRDGSSQIQQIADELGAAYLVTGSVRHAGKSARIHARLIEAESGYIYWTKRYDLDISDVLKAQEDIAERIAAAIEPVLESAELSRIATKRTDYVNAWDCFLQGSSFLHRYTLESNALAQKYFQQAIELDPDYSDAHTGLALSHMRNLLLKSPGRVADGDKHDRNMQIDLAFEAAQKAVALDQNSSDAHLQVGTAYVWIEDFDAALAETELAVKLNPSNAYARMALGNRLDLIGRNAEGIAQMRRSLELNPRDLNRWNFMGYLSRACLDSLQYDEALSWATTALRLRPDQPETHFRVAVCQAHLDRLIEAKSALAECERLCPGFVSMKSTWQPYSDPARSEHYFAGLRRLSLID